MQEGHGIRPPGYGNNYCLSFFKKTKLIDIILDFLQLEQN